MKNKFTEKKNVFSLDVLYLEKKESGICIDDDDDWEKFY